jgi:hypothetical protein
MKTQNYILILLIAFSCTMCNSSKKEDKIAVEKVAPKEKESEHKKLSPADSLKLVNHEIEVKGEVSILYKK